MNNRYDFNYDISKVKQGDRFYESEYGMTIYGEALEDVRDDGSYLSFKAEMSDGRTVEYGGSKENRSYWPTIVKVLAGGTDKEQRS